jgi:DNA repair exonuclease SbcCD ATPase subunit
MKTLSHVSKLVWFALIAVAMVACGPSKEEIQKKQIDELTAEMKQIDDAKAKLEGRMDSLAKDKEALVADLSKSKASVADMVTRLRAANAGIIQAKKENADLLKQVDMWRNKADSLAKVNAALQQQVADLTKRAQEAEAKVAAAEQRAADAEAKVREYEAMMANTYFVSKLDIVGVRGNEKDKKEQIRTNAQQLVFNITLARPKGGKAAAETKLQLSIKYPDNSTFLDEQITVKNDNDTYTLDVKGRKMDLRKGRYDVTMKDSGDNTTKFDGFFIVTR